jgi:prepilin-type N-terminal cleavage/methylation domain-containing protein
MTYIGDASSACVHDLRGGCAAFSLVEILVVLAIIAILATLAFPAGRGMILKAVGQGSRVRVVWTS